MNTAKTPRSLRSGATTLSTDENSPSGRKVSAVAGLIAVASFSGAEAQQSNLPPVTIDAPVARPRPAASKPTPDQTRARTALRRAARRTQPAQIAPVPFPNAGALGAPDRNPYADAAAPYKVDRLSGNKFSEPLLNTPKTVTVLSKELLEDKNATSLKEVARTTAGVTLGTGEGGNAFGDRFFIRGFDARNDIFIDGVRDPAVSIRENFFTEQVEILRGPASSFAGRGTTGGAINIVTKQAGDRNFYNAEATLGTDQTKRINLDFNQVISPTLSIRADGMFQKAEVAGRDYVTDDRWGGLLAGKWTPSDSVKITANYIHTDLNQLPDFGVPYNSAAKAPFTELGVPRGTYYGFVNRDFQRTKQDIGTLNGEFHITDDLTFNNKFRAQKSVLNYIGTIPEAPNLVTLTYQGNPQSRYQSTDVLANQSDFTYKFDTGPIKHTAVFGVEISRERTSIDSYTGLSSEAVGPGAFSGTGAVLNASIFNPPNLTPFPNFNPKLTGNATTIPVDTNSGYVIETANWRDVIILNGGIRYDDYNVSAHKAATPGTVVSSNSGMTNWNVGIVVKPVPFASVYAAYATSSNPVGAEVDGTSANYGGLNPTATINQIFAPQQSKAAEVGTKWELFDRHLLVTGALFQTTVSNAREAVPNGLPNAGTIVAGAGYQIQGIDLGVAGKITDKWSVFGGLVLMTNRVNNSVVASNIGLGLANIANQSFNVLTKYQLTDVWEIGGQATYRSKIYGGTLLIANQGTVLPDYWRFDAFVEAKVTKNLTVKFFANNLTNKLYYDAFYQSAAPFVFVAPGRSFSLVASAKF
ncbi:catecholate siderophore receptor [Nitrobacteraceae bacterium AZCC 2146]